jgi:hypothetical protein
MVGKNFVQASIGKKGNKMEFVQSPIAVFVGFFKKWTRELEKDGVSKA